MRRPSEQVEDETARDPGYCILWQVIGDNWNRPPGDGDAHNNDHDFGALDWGHSD